MENENFVPKLNRAQRRKLMNKVIFVDGTILGKRKVEKSNKANEEHMDLLDYKNALLQLSTNINNKLTNIEEDGNNE